MGVQSVVLTLVVLACYASRSAGLLIVDGSAYVFDEPELVEAVLDPSVTKILVASDIQLTPSAWPSPELVNVQRTITVSPHNSGLQNYTVDASRLTTAVVACTDPSCWVVVEGRHSLTFINIPGASSGSFDALFPNFLRVGLNGSLTVADVTVVSPQPTALWSAANALYSTNASWADSLLISCDSPASLLVDGLSVSSDIGLDPTLTGSDVKGTGRMQLSDVRMVLAQSFVCSRNYTPALCNDVYQICSGPASSQPLPTDACKPASLAQMCTPSAPSSPTNLSHIDDLNNARPGAPDSGEDSTPRWWIGLVAGAVSGVCCLIAVCYLVHMLRARRRARQAGSQLTDAKPGSQVNKGFGSTTPCAPDDPEHMAAMESGDSTSPAHTTAPSSNTPSAVTPVSNGQPNPEVSLRQPTGIVLPWGSFAQHVPVSPEELTGFSYHSSQMPDDFSMLHDGSLPAILQLGQRERMAAQAAGHRAVVIDLAPAQPAEPYQAQLSRNPLGVTLQTLLGTGAYGTVYAGLWQGQPAAIKVIKQQVHTGEDLEAILQFREATLGAELQHPRIVRTLAHALVIPEGMVDEAGRLARPGPVEAHIVSSLCDRGTLKGWLQLIWRAQTALSGSPMPSTTHVSTRLGALVVDSQAQHNAAVAGIAPHRQLSDSFTGSPTVGSFVVTASHTRLAVSTQHLLGPVAGTGSIGASEGRQEDSSSWESLQGPAGVQGQGSEAKASPPQPFSRIQGKASAAPSSEGSRMDVDLLLHSHEGIGSGKVIVETVSGGSKSAATVYPPLACMPVWGSTGLQLHSEAHCHLLAVLDCLLEVADGLRYLLSRGVVHGDLKPQNCLLCSDPADKIRGFTVKIGDFGISRVLHDTKSHTTVTQPPGTLAYFAPELLSTCRLSPACDLYSFGIIMYELLTCKQPLASLSMAQVLYKKATGKVDEFLVYPVEAPQEYVKLARACYSLEASSRPSLHEVLGRLAALREHLTLNWDCVAVPGPGPALSAPGSALSLPSHDSSTQEHASSKQVIAQSGTAANVP